jgi:hypothetical protein
MKALLSALYTARHDDHLERVEPRVVNGDVNRVPRFIPGSQYHEFIYDIDISRISSWDRPYKCHSYSEAKADSKVDTEHALEQCRRWRQRYNAHQASCDFVKTSKQWERSAVLGKERLSIVILCERAAVRTTRRLRDLCEDRGWYATKIFALKARDLLAINEAEHDGILKLWHGPDYPERWV